MHRRKRHGQRKHMGGSARAVAAPRKRIKPRNPLVPIVRRLGHERHGDRRGYRRHAKHKERAWD